MTNLANPQLHWSNGYQEALESLTAGANAWANTSPKQRIALLEQVKDAVLSVSAEWATTAARHKQIPDDSPLVGEEWLSGPYAVMSACNGFITTLSKIGGKAFLDRLPTRTLSTGQTAVQVVPGDAWDRLLLSGVSAEVWMEPGIGLRDLYSNAASAYDVPEGGRTGRVALVLGAGNIASIAPLDVFQKLLIENQVVLLKMNPVNDYLTEFLEIALAPLIDCDALRIVKGDGEAGEWLTGHELVDEIHITGAAATHDAIVWGTGAQGDANKALGRPKNERPITSELGAVCPTIVVPGPWVNADVAFQAEHLATQKLHNSGFNCIACQVLVLPEGWTKTQPLLDELASVMSGSRRGAYYPGAEQRLGTFAEAAGTRSVDRGDSPSVLINDVSADPSLASVEVFAPALSTHYLDAPDPESYLRNAIAWANDSLHGTLGASIIIHPETIKAIGEQRFEEIIAELHYGAIGINAWTGVAFLLTATPWGAFPGHTLEDVQSGIGTVHNTYMLENTERTVVRAPFRPFPRSVAAAETSLLPKPPWFITHARQHEMGELLTDFAHTASWSKLPKLFAAALRG